MTLSIICSKKKKKKSQGISVKSQGWYPNFYLQPDLSPRLWILISNSSRHLFQKQHGQYWTMIFHLKPVPPRAFPISDNCIFVLVAQTKNFESFLTFFIHSTAKLSANHLCSTFKNTQTLTSSYHLRCYYPDASHHPHWSFCFYSNHSILNVSTTVDPFEA